MTKGQNKAERKFIDCDAGTVLRLRRFPEMDTLLKPSGMVRRLSCGGNTGRLGSARLVQDLKGKVGTSHRKALI